MRTAALDLGDRRIGYALADPTGTIVSTTGVLHRSGSAAQDLEDLAAWIEQHAVDVLVVGHPLHLSGHAGSQALAVEEFVERLGSLLAERGIACRLVLWDERLSSVVAERYLDEISPRRDQGRRRDKGRVDALAAGIILQGYLERAVDARE